MSLDDYFKSMQQGNNLHLQCYKEHSKLATRLSKYGKVEGSYEGYLFEAIPIAVSEWDSSKGSACTVLFKVAQRLIQRDWKAQCYVGCVRVPHMTRDRYEGIEFQSWYAEGILDSSEADNT